MQVYLYAYAYVYVFVNDHVNDLGMSVGEALLSIHKSYLPVINAVLDEKWLVGISHITGGGIVENTMRILDKSQELTIDWGAWDRPAIFSLIQKLGNVPEYDLRQSMNLGIGMILIIKPEGFSHLQTHLATRGEAYIQLGSVS